MFPSVWKCGHVIPISKFRNPADRSSYRPISILPFLGKIFKLILFKRIERLILLTLSQDQYVYFPWSLKVILHLLDLSVTNSWFECLEDCKINKIPKNKKN